MVPNMFTVTYKYNIKGLGVHCSTVNKNRRNMTHIYSYDHTILLNGILIIKRCIKTESNYGGIACLVIVKYNLIVIWWPENKIRNSILVIKRLYKDRKWWNHMLINWKWVFTTIDYLSKIAVVLEMMLYTWYDLM